MFERDFPLDMHTWIVMAFHELILIGKAARVPYSKKKEDGGGE